MNPKIKRRVNVFNSRYKNYGYEMQIERGGIYLSADNSDCCDLVCSLHFLYEKKKCFLGLFPVSITLDPPALITDFLYYGMAILEEMQKEKDFRKENEK